jgi:hypothetical protein
MLKNMGFIMLTGAVMAVFFSPIYIEASTSAPSVKKEFVKKDHKEKKKGKEGKTGCPCSK